MGLALNMNLGLTVQLFSKWSLRLDIVYSDLQFSLEENIRGFILKPDTLDLSNLDLYSLNYKYLLSNI
jgi:hypothetical protein